ncbi:MFS transporter [Dinghuibacter silviterrae]|uniref:Fucose permease n=1 Tax=Dinghuibacter silviterrae TaxID=1539049 RepID=A0A4R8DNV3_9BACT|nr:MFS transporter [Dinghuibacter silviterrae]TDW99759.1 fucose permease [Dinghuibacter silviterrae]
MRTTRIKISIFVNYFLFGILLNSVGTVILQVQRYFKVLPARASLLEACKDLSIAVAAFLVTSLITRVGYKRSMLAALALIALTCCTIPLIHTFPSVGVLFIVTGICFALVRVSVYGTIGLITSSEKEHISVMNFIESFFCVGIFLGYFLFSHFIDDRDAGSERWFQVYFVLGALAAGAFVYLWLAPLDESEARAGAAGGGRAWAEPGGAEWNAMLKLLALPTVVSFVVCAFLYVLIEQSTMSWLPTFNNKVLNLPSTISVDITSLLAAAYAAGRLLVGLVIRRLNWFLVLVVCLLATAALVLVALPLVERVSGLAVHSWAQVPPAAFLLPLIGFLLAPVFPVLNSIILSSLPKHKQGYMGGLIGIFAALGGTLGSRITGLIFQYHNGLTAFYFSLLPITLLLAGLFVFRQVRSRPARKAAPFVQFEF